MLQSIPYWVSWPGWQLQPFEQHPLMCYRDPLYSRRAPSQVSPLSNCSRPTSRCSQMTAVWWLHSVCLTIKDVDRSGAPKTVPEGIVRWPDATWYLPIVDAVNSLFIGEIHRLGYGSYTLMFISSDCSEKTAFPKFDRAESYESSTVKHRSLADSFVSNDEDLKLEVVILALHICYNLDSYHTISVFLISRFDGIDREDKEWLYWFFNVCYCGVIDLCFTLPV